MANKRLNAVITIGGAVAGSLRGAFGAVTSETQKVGAAVQRLTERQRELNAQVARYGRDGSNAASLRVQYANQELAAIGKQIALLKRRDALERAGAANKAQRSELRGKIGSTVATGALAALPIGAAINKAASFQYELQMIGNTADMEQQQVQAMGAAILKVSKDTQQSAANIRRGMGFLVAAGMEADLATQFLVPIGKTATAAGADVEDLAKMVFTLNDSLKLQPDGMQDAIDTLAQAGKDGNVELRDMAKQLPVLGAGFLALKMQGREAAATMGAALQIARKGAADADEASNNMKNFIAKIMSPETLKKAQKNFNLDMHKIITDAQKTGKNPFEAAMVAVIKATKGDQKAIGSLFNDMQVQNFIRPMIQNWDKYLEIKERALSAKGVTDRDFGKIAATDKQKLNELANSMERLAIAVGGVFAGAGNGGAGLAQGIGQLTQFINENRELVATTAKVVGGLVAMRLAVLGTAYAWNIATGAAIAGRAVLLGMTGASALAAGASGWMRLGAAIRFVGAGLLSLQFGAAAVAAAAGYGVGTLLYKGLLEGNEAGNMLGRGIARTLAFFGNEEAAESLRQEDALGADNMPAGRLPAVPPMATRGGTNVQDNSTNTYTIVQQPGQDARALADELERGRRQQAGVRARSSLVDGVGAQ